MLHDDAIDPNISTLLDDIKLHVNAEMFKRHLEKCSRRNLESWRDADDFDLLHHAILENNFVVVGIFFALGYFKPPHEVVTSWLYIHLAAILGERTIISMLLQERPFDNKKVVLDWKLFHTVIAPKVDVSKVTTSIVPAEEKEQTFPFLPLDLAARYGHVMCVKTILDFHAFRTEQPQGPAYKKSSLVKTGYMNLACALDSPYALRLLLTDSPDNSDAENALDIALKTAKPECVDTLLRFGVNYKQLFNGMNLFHVLFAYSKSFEESWFESFVSVTSVLLRHHHDVNACRPSRTYPLYSLLSCVRIANIEKAGPFVIAGLLLLLQARADPNFDEIFVEEALKDKEHRTAFGRKPYSSALHCLADVAVGYVEEVADVENVANFVYKCFELLLRHGADASYVGRYQDVNNDGRERRGNVLHVLCDVAPRLGRLNLSSMLLLLLRHGADPDACADGRYPLMAYMDAICRGTAYDIEVRRRSRAILCCTGTRTSEGPGTHAQQRSVTFSESTADESDDVLDLESAILTKRMCRMLGFMSLPHQHVCEEELRSRLMLRRRSRDQSTDAVGACLRLVLRELELYTHHVPSLRRCCALIVWRQCRRHVGNVYKLKVPMGLINVVMDYL